MKKTKLMIEVEKSTGLNLETYLPMMYENRWKSSTYLGKRLEVHSMTIRRWLPKLGVKVRERNDYDKRKITRSSREELDQDYNIKRRKVSEIAQERRVYAKTVYRWMDRYGIPRRKSSEFFSSNGRPKPSNEKLETLLRSMSQNEVARELGVDPNTIRTLRQKAGAFEFRKSKYDSKDARKELLDMMLQELGKYPTELRARDFGKVKRPSGKSYRSLLNWYTTRFGYTFAEAREHIIVEFYNGR